MPIQAAQGGQDWHGYHPGAGRSRSNRCATNFPVGTAIALPAQRLSRRRERRLVADAAYHRRPYFTGAFRARATSQPLATLRDMLTLPILLIFTAGTLTPATAVSYTIWRRIARPFTKIAGKFLQIPPAGRWSAPYIFSGASTPSRARQIGRAHV